MKIIFFNEDVSLNGSQSAESHPPYKRIMDDKYVTPEELGGGSISTSNLFFRKIEDNFIVEQKQLVHKLIVESEVYQAVRKHFNEQIEFDGDLII